MSNLTNKHLKIGFVIDDSLDPTDGVQQYVLALGSWLSLQGHNVHYLTSTTKRTDLANVHSLSKNVAVRYNANRLSIPLPADKSAIRKVLEAEQFDVLHVQLPHSPLLAQRIIVAAGNSTAVIGTFHIVPHGWHVRAASRALALWTRPSLKKFDKIVSVSTAAQSFAKKSFGLETMVLPNVVDYDRFDNAKPFPEFKDAMTVVFLGRFVPRKGCMTLLKAVDKIVKQRNARIPGFRVVICGKGPLEKKLKDFVSEHQLESMVSFTGFVTEDDKPRYLKSAEIAVFPSTGGESFGIVLIEAMAAGDVVIGGDNVGYRSVLGVRPELLFKPKDVNELAHKLSYFLQDASARKDAATWGHEYAKQFDTALVGSKLAQIYNEALHEKRDVR